MLVFVNGFSSVGATSKEEMVAVALQAVKDSGYQVIGQPVLKERYNKFKVFVPAISKYGSNPIYCVRTFGMVDTQDISPVPFVDLTEKRKRY
jgi:hypothetical protein